MKKISVFLLVLLISGLAHAEIAVPALVQRITDQTNTLSAVQTQALETRLAAFETRKGAQIAVLILPTTQPESIEQYGIRAVEAWKLGRKGVDDGALLLVAKDDHTLRIEVGYGLEGAASATVSVQNNPQPSAQPLVAVVAAVVVAIFTPSV